MFPSGGQWLRGWLPEAPKCPIRLGFWGTGASLEPGLLCCGPHRTPRLEAGPPGSSSQFHYWRCSYRGQAGQGGALRLQRTLGACLFQGWGHTDDGHRVTWPRVVCQNDWHCPWAPTPVDINISTCRGFPGGRGHISTAGHFHPCMGSAPLRSLTLNPLYRILYLNRHSLILSAL